MYIGWQSRPVECCQICIRPEEQGNPRDDPKLSSRRRRSGGRLWAQLPVSTTEVCDPGGGPELQFLISLYIVCKGQSKPMAENEENKEVASTSFSRRMAVRQTENKQNSQLVYKESRVAGIDGQSIIICIPDLTPLISEESECIQFLIFI